MGLSNTLNIPLVGPTFPASLQSINVEVSVLGEVTTYQVAPTPNANYVFTWDGKDAYGNVAQGRALARVRLGYTYDGAYGNTSSFGASAESKTATVVKTRHQVTLWAQSQSWIGYWDQKALGLGTWSIDAHHVYDPIGGTLFLGDGRRRGLGPQDGDGTVLTTVTASSNPTFEAHTVATGPDGTSYFAGQGEIWSAAPGAAPTLIAGNGIYGFDYTEGSVATTVPVDMVTGVAVAPDGSVVFAEMTRIRKISPAGRVSTIAGSSTQPTFVSAPVPALSARMSPHAVAYGADGSLYFTDFANNAVRKLTTNGMVRTLAGTGVAGFSGDGGGATQAQLNAPAGIAVTPDGVIYVADERNNRVRRITPDGLIVTIAGGATAGYAGDGQNASLSLLSAPHDVAWAPDGSVYIADNGNNRVRRILPEGNIVTRAGNGTFTPALDNVPPLTTPIDGPLHLSLSYDGTLWWSHALAGTLRRIAPLLPRFARADITIPSDDGSQAYVFDSTGRHLRTVDARTGVVALSFEYDNAGFLTAIQDAHGNTVQVVRDSAEQAASIVSPFGVTTQLAYDGAGRLATVTAPDGTTTQLGYGTGDLLASKTDAVGRVHTYAYDTSGRLALDTETTGASQALSRAPTAAGTAVQITTGLGRTRTFELDRDAVGNATRTLTAADGTTQVVQRSGLQVHTKAANGLVTSATIGPDPRFGMKSPLLQTATVKTPSGLQMTLAQARTVTLANSSDPLSMQSLTETLTVNGTEKHVVTYNAATSQRTITSPAGRTVIESLDAAGRVVQVAVTGLDPVTVAYDGQGRPIQLAGSGRTGTLGYDANGYLDGWTDPLGEPFASRSDVMGRVTGATTPDGTSAQLSYDPTGLLLSATPPGKAPHAFSYDPGGRLIQYTPPSIGASASSTYAYTADDELASYTRADGGQVVVSRDGAGRITSTTYPGGTLGASYSATTGQLQSLTTGDGQTVALTYDGPLVLSATTGGVAQVLTTWAYDTHYRRSRETVGTSAGVSYGYDADSNLTSAGAETLNLNASNALLQGTTIGTVNETFSWSSAGELTGHGATYGTAHTPLYQATYVRDSLGRITSQSEQIQGSTVSTQYGYDVNGRLISVSGEAGYAWDSNGNRLTKTVGASVETAQYDAQDRLVSFNGSTYGYSADGELTSISNANGTTSLAYDGLGQLRHVALANGTMIDYVLDAAERRIGKKRNGVLVQGWVYGADARPSAQLDGTGKIVSRFVYGKTPYAPDYFLNGGITYAVIKDPRGSPRLVVNSSTGAVVERIDYDTFGKVVNDTNPGFQPFGFAGGLYDRDTGFVRLGAREYDPNSGRWTSKDPSSFAGGWNVYGYAGGDPVNQVDVTGHNPVLVAIGIQIAAGAALGAMGSIVAQAITTGCIDWGDVGAAALGGAFLGAVSGGLGAVLDDIAAIAQISEGKSMQAAVAALNEAGASQGQALQALQQVVANAEKELVVGTLAGDPGAVVLSGKMFTNGGFTKAIVIAADGTATFGSGVANYVDGVLEISEFLPQ
jgi:RHS repeat-associated protein